MMANIAPNSRQQLQLKGRYTELETETKQMLTYCRLFAVPLLAARCIDLLICQSDKMAVLAKGRSMSHVGVRFVRYPLFVDSKRMPNGKPSHCGPLKKTHPLSDPPINQKLQVASLPS